MATLLLIQGHPDADPSRFGRALAEAYAAGAAQAGHVVTRLDLSALSLPPLRSRAEWNDPDPPEPVRRAQRAIEAADHVVVFFPLWLGDMPALVKAFLEQVFRPGFAFPPGGAAPGKGRMKGRSARVVVTMGMPALFYRLFYRAHAMRGLRRNVLKFCGFSPVRLSLVGRVEGPARWRQRWLDRMHGLGGRGR